MQVAVRLSALLPAVCDDAWHEAGLLEEAYDGLRPGALPSLAALLEQLDAEFAKVAPALKVNVPARSLLASYQQLAAGSELSRGRAECWRHGAALSTRPSAAKIPRARGTAMVASLPACQPSLLAARSASAHFSAAKSGQFSTVTDSRQSTCEAICERHLGFGNLACKIK